MRSSGCPCCAYRQPLSGPRLVSVAQDRWERARPTSKRNIAVGAGSSRTLVLDGGTVVDPRDGSIAAMSTFEYKTAASSRYPRAEQAREDPTTDRIDAAGRFIVPGYNDMHSHALNLGDPSGSLALMLAEGVTGFRQMSGSPALLKKRRDNTLPIGPAAPALLETPGTILPHSMPDRKGCRCRDPAPAGPGGGLREDGHGGSRRVHGGGRRSRRGGHSDSRSPPRGHRRRGGVTGRLPVRRAPRARFTGVGVVLQHRRGVALGGLPETGDQGAARSRFPSSSASSGGGCRTYWSIPPRSPIPSTSPGFSVRWTPTTPTRPPRWRHSSPSTVPGRCRRWFGCAVWSTPVRRNTNTTNYWPIYRPRTSSDGAR